MEPLGHPARFLTCFLLVLIFSLRSTHLSAAPWRFAEQVLPTQILEKLKERYPDIKTREELQSLIEEISLKVRLQKLEVQQDESGWLFVTQRASVIQNIEFHKTPRLLISAFENTVNQFIGRVDGEDTRQALLLAITTKMSNVGYINSKASFHADSGPGNLIIVTDIFDPCIITGVSATFTMPAGVHLAVYKGEICNVEDIKAAIIQYEADLKDAGFTQAHIEFGGLQLNGNSTRGLVLIKGNPGTKIRYRVVDTSKRFLIGDLFTSGELANFDPSIIGPDAMAVEITNRYRNRGFIDVKVEGPEVSSDNPEMTTYTFMIDPGTQYSVSGVVFEGSTYFSTSELLKTMGYGSFLASSPTYNPDEVRRGIDAIKAAYQNDGFWNVEVTERTPTKGTDKSLVQISILIKEGLPRVLKRLILNGGKNVEVLDLLEDFPTKIGENLSRTTIADLQREIRSKYVRSGYLYAEAGLTVQENTEGSQIEVEVIINITEGPRVQFGDTNVVGLSRTDAKVVLRELFYEAGDWYDPEVLSETRRAILKLGIFSSVQISPLDPTALSEQRPVIDILISVHEGKPKSVSFGPGWSNYSGYRYSVEASHTNIGGQGRQVFARGGFSEEKHQRAIGRKTLVGRNFGSTYVEPYVLDLPVTTTFTANNVARASEDAWILTKAGEVELSHTLKRFFPGTRLGLFYGQKINDEESDQERKDVFLSDSVRIGRVGIRGTMDRRDDITWPTSGYTISSEVSWARYVLGGNLSYFRWEVGTGHYFAATPRLVFALGGSLASYQDVERKSDDRSGDVLPPSERLNAGGAETIRGFRERSLGPLVRRPTLNAERDWNCEYTVSPAGGSRRVVIKMEMRYRFTEYFGGTLFSDGGSTFFTQEEMSKYQKAFAEDVAINNPGVCPNRPRRSIEDNIPYDLPDLFKRPSTIYDRNYYSYGVAGNILTPIGSVNVAYGLPLYEPVSDACKDNDEFCYPRSRENVPFWRKGEFHINVGAKF